MTKEPSASKARRPADARTTPAGWIEPSRQTITPGQFGELQERLALAERRLQVVNFLASGVGALALAGVVGLICIMSARPGRAAADGTTLRAPLRIVDQHGTVLLDLVADGKGTQLCLADASGRQGACLTASSTESDLNLSGPGSGTATLLATGAGGQLTVSDGRSRPVAWLGARETGGKMAFWDAAGRDVLHLGAAAPGGSLSFTGRDGAVRTLALSGAEENRLALTNQFGQRVGPLEPAAERQTTRNAAPDLPTAAPQHAPPAPSVKQRRPAAEPPSTESRMAVAEPPAETPTTARREEPAHTAPSETPMPVAATLPGAAPLKLAYKLSDLALDLQQQGSYREAEGLLRRALSLYRRTLGPKHLCVASCLNNLGALQQQRGKTARAAALVRQALAIYSTRLPADHPSVVACRSNLAALYVQQGRSAEAAALLNRIAPSSRRAPLPAPKAAAADPGHPAPGSGPTDRAQGRVTRPARRESSSAHAVPVLRQGLPGPVASSAGPTRAAVEERGSVAPRQGSLPPSSEPERPKLSPVGPGSSPPVQSSALRHDFPSDPPAPSSRWSAARSRREMGNVRDERVTPGSLLQDRRPARRTLPPDRPDRPPEVQGAGDE